MNPFFVFNLPFETTDEQVESRYLKLVETFPPDLNPQIFMVIRDAYERLRTVHDRFKSQLLLIKQTPREIVDQLPSFACLIKQRRMTPDELAQWLIEVDESVLYDGQS
jgi:hypothetical protein